MWKLHGDIQLTYANCLPWMDADPAFETDEKALTSSILSWKNARFSAALSARHSYQQALYLASWQTNIYTDIAITIDIINSFKGSEKDDIKQLLKPFNWEWLSLKKACGIYCEVKNKEWKFDIWRWPKRKKEVICCWLDQLATL